MKAVTLREPIGLDTLTMEDRREPGPGAIRVRLHGSTLNSHGLGVVTGRTGAPAGRVSDAKLERAKALGAEFTVNHHRADADWGRVVRDWTGGGGVDRAPDATGIRPVTHRRFPLGALADAFRFEQDGSHFGKIGVE